MNHACVFGGLFISAVWTSAHPRHWRQSARSSSGWQLPHFLLLFSPSEDRFRGDAEFKCLVFSALIFVVFPAFVGTEGGLSLPRGYTSWNISWIPSVLPPQEAFHLIEWVVSAFLGGLDVGRPDRKDGRILSLL